MQSINKRQISFALMLSLLTMIVASVFLTSCNDDDDDKGTQIWTIGPGNVNRGDVLKICGQQLGSVASVVLPSLNGSGIEIPRSEFQKAEDGYIEVKLPNDKNFVSGNVIVKLDNGESITSKVAIKVGTLVLESFSPATVRPGQEITIYGEYLTLVKSVVFANNQEVLQDAFKTQTNDQIVVSVPDAAQSGNIAVSDGESAAYSADKLVVTLPSSPSFESKDYKPGVDKITITGKDMGLVRFVKFEGAEVASFDSQSETAITFTVPATTKVGGVTVIPGSGINVPAGEIELVKAVVNTATEEAILGGNFTITGTDLDLIGTITLGGAEQVFKVNDEGSEITFKVASLSKSGLSVFESNGVEIYKSEAKVNVCKITNIDGLNAGAATTISFEGDTSYIGSLKIGDYDVEITKAPNSANKISAVIPAQVKGETNFSILGVNGEWASEKKEIIEFEGPVITSMPDNCKFGSSILLMGYHLDKATSVTVGNTSATDFINKGTDKMYLTIPALPEEGSYPITISDGEKSSTTYGKITIADASVSIWKGEWENTGWSGNQDLAWGGYNWSKVKAGSKLYFYLTQTTLEDWGGWQLALRHGDNWGELPSSVYISISGDEKTAIVEYELNQATIDDLIANGGLVITGTKYVMTEVKILLP